MGLIEKPQYYLHEIQYVDKKLLWQTTVVLLKTYIVFQNEIILTIALILDVLLFST